MKKDKIFLLLFSFLFVTNIAFASNLPEDCTKTCRLVNYDFGESDPHLFPKHCFEKWSCQLLEWDNSSQTCVVIEETTISVPIPCRDIPPAF